MMNRKKWLDKKMKEGKADETFLIIRSKKYTPRDITKNELFWMQVVKSV